MDDSTQNLLKLNNDKNSIYLLDLQVYEGFDPPSSITRHIMVRFGVPFSVRGDHISRSRRSKKS